MSFSLKTVLLALVAVATFFAGWMLPPPMVNSARTPVLVAVRDIPSRTAVRDADFRIVYRDIEDVPDYAARTYSDLEGVVTAGRVRCNGYFFLDESLSNRDPHSFNMVPGKKVLAIKLGNTLNKFTWYLLSENDIVSIYLNESRDDSVVRTCLIPRCTVFSKPSSEKPSVVGVWLTELESELVGDAQRRGMQLSFEPPE